MISDLIRRFGGRAPSVDLQEVRQGQRAPYLYFDVDLTTARSLAAGTALIQNVGGNVLYADPKTASGIARVYVIGDLQPIVPVTVYPGSIFSAPFTRLIIENDAQPGLSMRVLYGTDIDFLPGIGGARPVWYDRSPAGKTFLYATSNIAPHGVTQRWIYTVPAGRKAIVESADVSVVRQTAGAPVGFWDSYIVITSGASQAYTPRVTMLTNGVGDRGHAFMSLQAVLMGGDTLEGYTRDLSTGGTVAYFNSAKLTEYDA